LATLSLLTVAAPSQCTPEQLDSFCKLYTAVIVEKGDGKIIASIGVKKRLLENELLYREECPKPEKS
jgi:hypothetical protein